MIFKLSFKYFKKEKFVYTNDSKTELKKKFCTTIVNLLMKDENDFIFIYLTICLEISLNFIVIPSFYKIIF